MMAYIVREKCKTSAVFSPKFLWFWKLPKVPTVPIRFKIVINLDDVPSFLNLEFFVKKLAYFERRNDSILNMDSAMSKCKKKFKKHCAITAIFQKRFLSQFRTFWWIWKCNKHFKAKVFKHFVSCHLPRRKFEGYGKR